MGTLLLRLVGPMQSWGTQSHFTNRDTGLEPSKSGVIGLLCAALGKPRNESHPENQGKPTLAQLAELQMGVRVDREGLLKMDYHTAGKSGYLKAKGDVERKTLIVSHRYYLADAAFLVGLEGDPALLHQLHHALQHPYWLLFLGRKAFPPSEPIWLPDGLRISEQEENLFTALSNYWRLRPKRNPFDDDRMRLVLEDQQGEIARRDVPLSFVKGSRNHGMRRLRSDSCADRPLLTTREK